MGWGIFLGILLLLAIIPLGIWISYDGSGFRARVIAGPVKITVFPRKKNSKKSGKSEENKQKKDTAPKAGSPKPEQKKAGEQGAEQSGGSLEKFLPLIRLGLDFLGDFRRKIRLNHLYMHVVLAGDDPCDLAVNYGRAWAAVGNLIPNLEHLFVIKKRDIQVSCDFTASEATIVARGDITITFGRLLCLGVPYGIRVLKLLLAMKRKGGAQA